MAAPALFSVRLLPPGDAALLEAMSAMFGEAFGEAETYRAAGPSAAYLERLLGGQSFIAIAALKGGEIVGGLAAYELRKFEQERSEVYLYDLAVAEGYRREGIATALIRELREGRGGARGLRHLRTGRPRRRARHRALHEGGDARGRPARRHSGFKTT